MSLHLLCGVGFFSGVAMKSPPSADTFKFKEHLAAQRDEEQYIHLDVPINLNVRPEYVVFVRDIQEDSLFAASGVWTTASVKWYSIVNRG